MLRFIFKCALFLLFFLYLAKSFAKDYPMVHFTIENGLPSNNIYTTYKDHNDFLWIATDKGILKYNGITFERFTTSDGLPDNDVFFFEEDYEGRLWMSCYNGEMCFYKDGIIHTAANTPYLKLPFKHTYPARIEIEEDSTVSFLYLNTPSIISIKGSRFKLISYNDQLPREITNVLIHLHKTKDGKYLFLYSKMNYVADTIRGVINSYHHKNNDEYRYSYQSGQRFLYSHSGIYSMNEDLLLKFVNKNILFSSIYSIVRYDSVWFICTDHGVFLNNDIQILKGSKITSVTRDVEGNYWLSSLNNGIFYLKRDFLNTALYNDAYQSDIRYARVVGDDLFYTEANGNLYRFKDGKPLLLFDYLQQVHAFKLQKNEPENHFISGLGKLIDDQYNYYSIETNCGFVIKNINTSSRKIILHEQLRRDNCKEILNEGKYIYIRDGNFVDAYVKDDLERTAMPEKMSICKTYEKRVYTIALGNDSQLWYSLVDSVYRIENGIPKAQPQFGNLAFKQMCITGNVLAGISQKNQIVICNHFEKKIAISTYVGNECVCDKMHRLNDSSFLVSTDNQYRVLTIHPSVDKPKFEVQVIENNALPLQPEYVCNNDSICYFFKNGCITRVPLSSIVVRTSAPRIYFRYLKTRNNTYPITKGMTIGYDESKNINISFAPFSFSSRSLVCEYSISNDSVDYWRPLNSNEINLFDPGYGHYIVKMKAKTLSGNFSAPYIFNFTISKPFWARGWFFILVGFCIVLFLLLIIRYNLKRVAKEKNYLEKELSTLRLQMNPHFLFNTLNSIYSLSKINSAKTPDMVHKLSEMLRYVTYKSAKPLTTISEEIEIIDSYIALQAVRYEKRVEIIKQIDIDEPGTAIVPLLLLPLIENAYKHGIGMLGDNSFIHISITLKRKILRMEVSNSIASESVRQDGYEGLGLSNTRRQLALLYKQHELTVSDSDGIFALQLTININSYAGVKLPDNRG